MSKKWVNATAKDVVTISGSTWNANTRTVANAVNYNAQILKEALNRIEELEKAQRAGYSDAIDDCRCEEREQGKCPFYAS